MKIITSILVLLLFTSPVLSYDNLSGKKLVCSETLKNRDENKSFILGFDFIDKSKAKIIYASFIPLDEWESFLELPSIYEAKLNKIVIQSQHAEYKWKYTVNRESLDVFFEDNKHLAGCEIVDISGFTNLYNYISVLHEKEKIFLIKKIKSKNKI